MKLINIANTKRIIHLFFRDDKGKQTVETIDDFHPYYYEKEPDGTYLSIYGDKLKKIPCSDPSSIRKQRTQDSFESDIIYTRRYMIDKVNEITHTVIKWSMIDIEIKTHELPSCKNAIYPISSISVYNSTEDEIKTFSISPDTNDIKGDEQKLMGDFIEYMKKERFDLWISWHVSFDYSYCYERTKKIFGQRFDFAREISPIKAGRRAEWGEIMGDRAREELEDIWFPAGISIIDFMQWFKKLTLNRRKAYNLQYIAEYDLGEEPSEDYNFNQISQEIIDKNINDVARMIKLEDKYGIIQYFDNTRRLSKVEWEDLYHNSRVLDMLCLQEAKKRNLILPSKATVEKEDYEGAFREAFETGRFFNVGKVDLGSAYPMMIKEFCLDPVNLTDKFGEGIIPITIKHIIKNKEDKIVVNKEGKIDYSVGETYNYKQDPTAILPTVVGNLLTLKDKIKEDLKNCKPDNEEHKITKTSYDSIKSLVNSAYGVMGNRFFRLYDKRIAETITHLVRDVLVYSIEKMTTELKTKIIYADTDSIFYNKKDNFEKELNKYIQEWANKYKNKRVTLEFEYEGYFEKLLILKKCRYRGFLMTSKGIKEETKGIEMKRNDSSDYMKKFQEELTMKILDNVLKKEIINWIKESIKKFKDIPIIEIAIPGKLSKPVDKYKNKSIHVRALECSDIKKAVGERFFWIYIKPKKIGTRKVTHYLFDGKKIADKTAKEFIERAENAISVKYRKKEYTPAEFTIKLKEHEEIEDVLTNVIAFDKDTKDKIKDVDYDLMVRRNIFNKCDVIFQAMLWDIDEIVEVQPKTRRKKDEV